MTHYTNTKNPIDFPKMTTYRHIVQVHPVENGLPNLYKVVDEFEFDAEYDAKVAVMDYNLIYKKTQAVYHGRVNDETGELE